MYRYHQSINQFNDKRSITKIISFCGSCRFVAEKNEYTTWETRFLLWNCKLLRTKIWSSYGLINLILKHILYKYSFPKCFGYLTIKVILLSVLELNSTITRLEKSSSLFCLHVKMATFTLNALGFFSSKRDGTNNDIGNKLPHKFNRPRSFKH